MTLVLVVLFGLMLLGIPVALQSFLPEWHIWRQREEVCW